MLTLYRKNGCPYAAKVFAAGKELNISFNEKNIEEPEIRQELIARGGKKQTPYLVDDENGTEMYESDDIVQYLHTKFGHKALV